MSAATMSTERLEVQIQTGTGVVAQTIVVCRMRCFLREDRPQKTMARPTIWMRIGFRISLFWFVEALKVFLNQDLDA
jgi:tellurite resistance protein TehA-like permease